MKRIYIEHQDFGKALQYAVAAACAEANNGSYSKIVFLTITNGHQKTMEETIRMNLPVQKMANFHRFAGCNTNFIVTTLKHYPQGLDGQRDIVIYCSLQSDEILHVEEKGGVEVGIAIKDYRSIELWGGTWGVSSLKADGLNLPDYDFWAPSVKVQNAIRKLTKVINLSNSKVFHISDEDLVKAYVRTLIKYEQQAILPEAVVAFAIRECRWNYNLASLMGGYFEKLNSGKSFKGGVRTAKEMKDLYQMW